MQQPHSDNSPHQLRQPSLQPGGPCQLILPSDTHMPPSPKATPPVQLQFTSTNFPPTSTNMSLPPQQCVDSGDAVADAISDDLWQATLGVPNPDFVDSQEHLDGGRASSCDGFSSSEDDDNDNVIEEVDITLEDTLWPPEMLHGPQSLKKTTTTPKLGFECRSTLRAVGNPGSSSSPACHEYTAPRSCGAERMRDGGEGGADDGGSVEAGAVALRRDYIGSKGDGVGEGDDCPGMQGRAEHEAAAT